MTWGPEGLGDKHISNASWKGATSLIRKQVGRERSGQKMKVGACRRMSHGAGKMSTERWKTERRVVHRGGHDRLLGRQRIGVGRCNPLVGGRRGVWNGHPWLGSGKRWVGQLGRKRVFVALYKTARAVTRGMAVSREFVGSRLNHIFLERGSCYSQNGRRHRGGGKIRGRLASPSVSRRLVAIPKRASLSG